MRMSKRKEVVLDRISLVITILIMLWVGASHIDVLHNRGHIHKWNFYKLVFIDTHAESKQIPKSILAEHEFMKGQQKLILKPKFDYTSEDVMILAQIINTECGASYLSDELSFYVGSVVLNRVMSDRFPNTIKEVAYAPGQYSPVGSARWYTEPNERSYEIATELLEQGSVLPPEVVWQANFKQGKGVYIHQEGMYFCY